MEPQKITVSMVKAQVLAIGALIPLSILLIPFWWIHGFNSVERIRDFLDWRVALPTFLLGIIVHEFIHGITWASLCGKSIREIKFGVQWKTLTPYAHSPFAMNCRIFRWGAVMPLLVLGIAPYIVALILGLPMVMGFALLNILAATGDLLILWITRHLPADQWVQDHPTEGGVWLVEPDPLSSVPSSLG
jgi:hypothetical protein